MSTALLSFKIGPVQPFIEAARTLRDLWSGSYLLSWLTAHAMKPLILAKATFITPDVDVMANPLLRAVISGERGNPDATLACLPHTFAAEVPADQAMALKKTVIDAVRDEWKWIACAVKAALDPTFRAADPQWDTNWQKQIDSHFEITCVVLALDTATDDEMERLNVEMDDSQDTPDNARWGRRWNLLGALVDLARSVRHVPPYTPAKADKYPVKCSLLGSYEQVGPGDFRESQEFWERVVPKTRSGFGGSRLQPADKLCAVSLVKRFAWAVDWSKRLGLPADLRRLSDTATMAAKKWLADGEPMDPDELRDEHRNWNGQWLHWAADDQGTKDGDPKRPKAVADRLAHKVAAQKRPPTYYALLHLDGDNMGQVFQGDIGKKLLQDRELFGVERFHEVTTRLTSFALINVKRIVEQNSGELIYAGGDDVLAFLPTETVIDCARQLREAFGKALGREATLSGGIAVVHYKEDLRFALGQVRAAEKAAKRIARTKDTKPKGKIDGDGDPTKKDALALTICKRSGEHATVVMGWPEAEKLQELVAAFNAGASDRWAYTLRAELETLKGLPLEAGKAEAMRLVGRGENATDQFKSVIESLFTAYQKQMQDPSRNWPDADVLTGFVTLVQAASFLARGKE